MQLKEKENNMKFTPKTKEEAMRAGLLPKGVYPFVVIKAENKTSKSGNPMVELLLKIWDVNGKEYLMYDYLMESIEYKLRHFCYSIGMGEMSEKGEFDVYEVKGKQGSCKIIIKEDKNGEYPPKNSVSDYLEELPLSLHNAKKQVAFEDSELPF
jgi:Protein of unknown function (DUF669)